MKVSAILKGQPDSLGRRTVYIRVNSGQKRNFKALNMKAHPDEWDQHKGQYKASFPQAKKYNDLLKRYIVSTETKVLEKSFDVYASDMDLLEYSRLCLQEWESSKEYSTINKYYSELKKIKEYCGKIYLSQVTPGWLSNYRAYLLTMGNNGNTIWASFKFIRTVIRKAHNERRIPHNPFDLFEMPKYKDPKKIFLSKEQVQAIDELCQKEGVANEIIHAATWFVISCYTGLRFSDLAAFNKDHHIKSGRLIIYTGKTGEVVSMPVDDKLRELFERVKYQPLKYANATYNKLLKSIAAAVHIKENVSAHTARHTFGTLAASAGISQEVAAKLMGHVNLRTTAIYYKITNPRIDEELKRMR
jgi:integrase/recombinase XerD